MTRPGSQQWQCGCPSHLATLDQRKPRIELQKENWGPNSGSNTHAEERMQMRPKFLGNSPVKRSKRTYDILTRILRKQRSHSQQILSLPRPPCLDLLVLRWSSLQSRVSPALRRAGDGDLPCSPFPSYVIVSHPIPFPSCPATFSKNSRDRGNSILFQPQTQEFGRMGKMLGVQTHLLRL